MLVPLTRKKFEELIPLVATAAQYRYCWGKIADFLRRLLISVVSVVLILIVGSFLGTGFGAIKFVAGFAAGFYWLWAPIYSASLRNSQYRRHAYSGFWQGEVLDVFITEELIGKEKTVNNRGDLVIIENRERRVNLEVGDETGFRAQIQAPLRREHQTIAPGQVAQLVVLSNQPDLGRIAKISDVYLPSSSLWVNDYPYLRRDVFVEVSRRLRSSQRDDRYEDRYDERGNERRRSPRKPSKQFRRREMSDVDW